MGYEKYLDYFNTSQNKDIQYITKFIKSKVIDNNISTLICGETGTGKEIVTRLIHGYSSRCNKPLITVNCSQIPESLFDSTMFGYLKGSYTGARETKEGHFGMADNGTLYLDEVDSLPKNFQVKLLRALENKEFYRVGASVSTKVNINIISSFGRSPIVALQQGMIREDLFYRLAGIVLTLPTLNERIDDFEWFLKFYKDMYSKKYNKTISFKIAALEYLRTYSWPGNIREFKSFIERLFVIESESIIAMHHVKDNLMSSMKSVINRTNYNLQHIESEFIIEAMKTFKLQNIAAKALGISPRALCYKLKFIKKSNKGLVI